MTKQELRLHFKALLIKNQNKINSELVKTRTINKINRLLSKFAYREEFEGDTEHRTAAYSNVREDSSTGSTYKLPLEVEFGKKSIDLLEKLKVQFVGIYYPLKYEINLLEIVKLHPEIKFLLPKIIENEIKYCSYSYNDQLVLGSYKTFEPINNNFYNPSLIIVPGLAFSYDGYRLGYGKGHFDRYISSNRDILTVGICLKEQLIDKFEIEPHDQKLDYIISI